ncbi:hypothetical protein E3V39_12500 [Gammaproteobacteria bacterium LSUCC0112]|nr:hypothetical protein E3V39_12500 [Gammaproteobacteria bacterium LSUCC0112]
MIYQTTCGIIFKGDRVKKGVQLDLTKEEAAHLGTDVVPFATVEAKEEVKVEPKEVSEMTHAELKAYAEELGLSKAGSKADLEERIKLSLEAKEEVKS